MAVAEFIQTTTSLDWNSLKQFLHDRDDVLDCLVCLQDYHGVFLPNALREFFSNIPAPDERGQFLETLVDKFTRRYTECNTDINISKGRYDL